MNFKQRPEPVIMVHCPACGCEENEEKVKCTNICEDMFGRDEVTFNCPKCQKTVVSWRFTRRGY